MQDIRNYHSTHEHSEQQTKISTESNSYLHYHMPLVHKERVLYIRPYYKMAVYCSM